MRVLPLAFAALVLQLFPIKVLIAGLDYHNSPSFGTWFVGAVSALAGMALTLAWASALWGRKRPVESETEMPGDSAVASVTSEGRGNGCVTLLNFGLGLVLFLLFIPSAFCVFAAVTEFPLFKDFFK